MDDPIRHVAETSAGAVVASSYFWLHTFNDVVSTLAAVAGLVYMLLKIWQVLHDLRARRGRIEPLLDVLLPWVVAMLLAGSATAAPPEGAPTSGPVHDWFQKPEVRACCSEADCRARRIRPSGDGWEVEYEGRWIAVPPEAIKTDPSPVMSTIVCIPPYLGVPTYLFFGGST